MPVYTIEQLKFDARSPLQSMLNIVDFDTFFIGDGTGVIVLDTSKYPNKLQT